MTSRDLTISAAVMVVVGALCTGLWLIPSSEAAAPVAVRLALVRVPEDVLGPLLPKFKAQTGMEASIVYTGRDPFSVAREGKADLVISHYGHEGVQEFVLGGFGLWPHPVFANQIVLLGPTNDPAGIRGMANAA